MKKLLSHHSATRRRALQGALQCIALPVALATPWVWAQDGEKLLLEKLHKRLADDAIVRGQFEQRKQIKGFKQPLLSKGDFVVARQKGVVWRTREPIVNVLVLTKDRLTSRQADGRVVQQLDSQREPMVRLIIELMFAMLSADMATLSQRFKFEGEVREDGWSLVLTPKDAALTAWASRIESQGDRYVRQVQWQDSMGDTTTLRMTAQQAAASLSREEEAYLV